MATERDAGRAKKLTWLGLAGLVTGVVGGGYLLWGWLFTPPPPPSQLNLDRVTASTNTKSSETPAYREQLALFNRQGAAQAQSENKSFIASIPFEQQPVVLSLAKPAPGADIGKNTQGGEQDASRATGTANTPEQDSRRLQALDKFLAKLNPESKEQPLKGLQTGRVLGGSGGEGGLGGGAADNSYALWSQSLNGGVRAVSSSNGTSSISANTASASVVPIEIIPPYWRGPGIIDIGVDSDNSTTPVLGKIGTGRYAGAVLKANDGAKLTGEGVVIHFTEMAYQGINYTVDAYALQEDSLLANVASDVNHRYFSRIVLPAVLSGIGGLGEMYSQANTQLVSNGFNTQVVRPSVPDGSAVLGAVAGAAASQAAKVLSEDASRIPATQVRVFKGQVVAIQFMRGVYAGDAMAPGQGGEAVKAAVPAVPVRTSGLTPVQPVQPATEEQWRAAARLQIQSQQRQSMQELTP